MFILNYFLSNLNPNQNYQHQGEVIKSYSKSCLVKEEQNFYFVIFSDYCTDLIPHTIISFNCYYYPIEQEYNSFNFLLLTNHAVYYGYSDYYQIEEYAHQSFRNLIYLKLVNRKQIYNQLSLLFLYKKETIYNQDLANLFQNLGISFLIIISGFHILLIIKINNFWLKKIIKKDLIKNLILFLLTTYYLYFFYFPITGIKSLIDYFCKQNKKIKKGNFNSIALTGLFFLTYNPYSALNSGLILSFLISFAYKFFHQIKIKNNLYKFVILNIFIFMISFPFVINWSGNINLLSPLICIILNPIIKITYFILFFSIFFPFSWDIVTYGFIPLLSLLFLLKDFKILLYYNSFNFYQIIIYQQLIWIIILFEKKIFDI
ncbi:MAG: hypothetical protein HPPSJP_2570 [Candidatus Hepatoplasma scabrum]|nr:MAG: hypothetical protein HPPSJP_2570 [Candidatus Hepatoplasma sp.]